MYINFYVICHEIIKDELAGCQCNKQIIISMIIL